MAFGDVYVQVEVPAQPAGSTLSGEEYIDEIKEKLKDHFATSKIDPARANWSGRSDVPKDGSSYQSYLNGLLGDTDIDASKVTYTLPTVDETYYCVVSTSEFYCYSGTVQPVWSGESGKNPFERTFTLSDQSSVVVKLTFVVRWLQAF